MGVSPVADAKDRGRLNAATVSRFLGWRLGIERRAILRLQSLAERWGRKRKLPAHLRVGERGELEALFFVRRLGFTVVARRWRTAELRGDLDLVAWEGETLCFVEVKTRSVRDRTPAWLAVDQQKRRMLARMARAYLRTLPRSSRRDPSGEGSSVLTRMDVVSVYLGNAAEGRDVECEIIRDSFDWRAVDTSRYGV